jgi:WD40 repeat protein
MTKEEQRNPVVASLKSSASSYHSIALSPCRDYAVLACKDTLQMIRICPEGLHLIKTVAAAPFFQQPTSNKATTTSTTGGVLDPGSLLNLRDFALGGRSTTVPSASTLQNDTAVVISDVAWSSGRTRSAVSNTEKDGSMHSPEWQSKSEDGEFGDRRRRLRTSMIAAAGSNGIIALWNAAPLLDATGNTAPVAILNQHNRQVNRLAWHPGNDHILLSASQDWTVVLWERRAQKTDASSKSSKHRSSDSSQPVARNSFFGALVPTSSSSSQYPHKSSTKSVTPSSYQWHYRTTFAPKSEAVRDIQWSPFYEDGAYHVNDSM